MSRQNARKPRFRFAEVGMVETGLPERLLGGRIVKAGERALNVRDMLLNGPVSSLLQVGWTLRRPGFAFIQD
jgi:hypothetical protein